MNCPCCRSDLVVKANNLLIGIGNGENYCLSCGNRFMDEESLRKVIENFIIFNKSQIKSFEVDLEDTEVGMIEECMVGDCADWDKARRERKSEEIEKAKKTISICEEALKLKELENSINLK